MSDLLDVISNSARDSAAIVGALSRGDVESAQLLMSFYSNNSVAQAALCGSLAAFATALLRTIDSVGEEIRTVHGVAFPTSQQVLASVLVKLAEPEAEPC